ncbi:MAG: hypothetical protein JKY19_09665 [Alcanivoracaceae bacterium]|nr:hypothetical protein [Alcanivoracaceae bacterium]
MPPDDWRIAEAQNIHALLSYQKNKEASLKVYHCSYQILKEKLGENHYRVKAVKLRGWQFNISKFDVTQVDCASQN